MRAVVAHENATHCKDFVCTFDLAVMNYDNLPAKKFIRSIALELLCSYFIALHLHLLAGWQ